MYADTSGRQGFRRSRSVRRLADDDWPAYGRKLTELAERMAAFGVRMAFHHHMGTIVESEADIDRLMAATGEAVGLLFDSGHCLFAGGDPAALLARHIGRVVHVHCKDVRATCWIGRSGGHDVPGRGAGKRVHRAGDGCIAFTPLLRRLCDAGYAGWLVVEAEQDPRKAHPLTYARLGYRNLRAMAVEAGFEVVDE